MTKNEEEEKEELEQEEEEEESEEEAEEIDIDESQTKTEIKDEDEDEEKDEIEEEEEEDEDNNEEVDKNNNIKKEILFEINNSETESNIINNEMYSTFNNKIHEGNIEKDYFGNKGIIKRTIGTGKVNVKVYEEEDDENDSNNKDFFSNINYKIKSNDDITDKLEKLDQESKDLNDFNNIIKSSNFEIDPNIIYEPEDFGWNSIIKTSNFGMVSNSWQTKELDFRSSISRELEKEDKDKENKNLLNKNMEIIEEKEIINNNVIANGNNSIKKSNANKNRYIKKNTKNFITYKIDGIYFVIDVEWSFSYNDKNQKNINIKLSTIYPGSQVIHWAIFKAKSPKDWIIPPKSYYPKLTKRVDYALETEFCPPKENNERTISIILPEKINKKDNIEGIQFAVYDPIKNMWYNNFKNNFIIHFNNSL